MGDTFNAILLGLVQGATEFLPISSSGHLILLREAISFHGAHELAFDAVLQLATALAIIVYFWSDLFKLFRTFLSVVGGKVVEEKDRVLFYALILGTIPAVIGGLLLENAMETVFREPLLVAFVLVAGSGLFAYAEYVFATRERAPLTVWTGTMVGLFQVLALVPGMSRSGATISGGLLLGLSRVDATRLSFLLAIPILLGAGTKKLFEILAAKGDVSLGALFIGAVVSFSIGMLAIHFMLIFVRNHTLWPFIWYRLALALVVVVFFLGG